MVRQVVYTEKQQVKAIKICNSSLNSALWPVVEVYCKLKRITAEGSVHAPFSQKGRGFLQSGRKMKIL